MDIYMEGRTMSESDAVDQIGHSLRDKARETLAVMVLQANDDLVWEGRLTEVVGKLGHIAYYTKIVDLLKDGGAATQLKRGSMGNPSVWQIDKPDADFEDVILGATGKRIKSNAKMQVQIDNIEKLVGGINVPAALHDIQLDINLLKAQLARLLDNQAEV